MIFRKKSYKSNEPTLINHFIMLLFIILVKSSIALHLLEFDNFKIDFNEGCSHYLTLLGSEDYVNLSKESGYLTLLVGHNETYRLQKFSWDKSFVFSWPDSTINGNEMDLVEEVGKFDYPLSFNYSRTYCNIEGLRAGSLDRDPTDTALLTYQCPSSENWKVYLPSALAGLLSMFLFAGGYRSLHPRVADYIRQNSFQRIPRKYESTV